MAIPLGQVGLTHSAYEHSETLVASPTVAIYSADLMIPANTGQVTFCIRRKTGDALFKVQTTQSSQSEINLGNAEWFDWEVPSLDVDGYYSGGPDYQYWLPIPSGIRFVIKATATPSTVYYGVRAN